MTDLTDARSSATGINRLAVRVWMFIGLIAVNTTSALSSPLPGPCRVERQEGALAACLEMAFAQRVVKMSQNINATLAHLQAARPNELLALQRQYDEAQDVWLDRLTEDCERIEGANVVAVQKCRLDALPEREDRLALSLQRAADDFGAPLAYSVPTPRQVEIHIPLAIPLPFSGTAEIPLLIPISPN